MSIGRWIVRLCVGAFALFGATTLISAGALWFMARPVLDQARVNYAALPSDAQCERRRHAHPPGYPSSYRPVQTPHDVELSVYRDACADAGLDRSCAYMVGGLRQLGFSAYRDAYVSSCEVLALNLHGDTPLHRALERLYPNRDPSTLTEPELSCVSLAARAGSGSVCRIHATCCSDSMLAPAPETHR